MFDCTLGSLCHRWSSLAQALLKSGQSSICRHCLNEVVSLLICHGPLQCVVRSSTPLLALSMGEPTSSTVNSEFRSRPQSNSDCGSPSSTMASSRALQQLLQLQRGGRHGRADVSPAAHQLPGLADAGGRRAEGAAAGGAGRDVSRTPRTSTCTSQGPVPAGPPPAGTASQERRLATGGDGGDTRGTEPRPAGAEARLGSDGRGAAAESSPPSASSARERSLGALQQ